MPGPTPPEPSVGLMVDPAHGEHDPGPGHPESPRRVEAVLQRLELEGLRQRCLPIAPRSASDDDLLLCHTAAYLGTVRRDLKGGRSQLSTGDTDLSPGSEAAARRALGGALAAVDAVMAGTVRRALALTRPPGHHAESGRGMGFCLFNNVAACARHAQARHGLERVLILDWDVHHGNGTQEIFWRDPSVLFVSVHEWPLYPGTGAIAERGAGAGEGFTLNLPLPAGSGGPGLITALERLLLPAVEAFAPDLVLLSAGFDGRLGDPLGHFQLSDADYTALTRLAIAIAERHGAGRLVSCLEGGYALDGLGRAVAAHTRALLDDERPQVLADPPAADRPPGSLRSGDRAPSVPGERSRSDRIPPSR